MTITFREHLLAQYFAVVLLLAMPPQWTGAALSFLSLSKFWLGDDIVTLEGFRQMTQYRQSESAFLLLLAPFRLPPLPPA